MRAVLTHNREKNLFERGFAAGLAGNSSAQLFKRTLGHKPAFVNDGHVAAKALDNFQNVRRQENRSAALRHAPQKSFEHTRCERVPLCLA